MRLRTFMTLMAIVLCLMLTGSVVAMQDPAQDIARDPIEQLRLTPEQRQRIRIILAENKDDRQIANRRLREANAALDHALDAERIDENLIEQRVNDVAAAHAAQLRMRIQMELRIRRELRPEQLAILRDLRLKIRDVMGVQRPTFNQNRGRQGVRPNRRNGAFPQRNIRQPQ